MDKADLFKKSIADLSLAAAQVRQFLDENKKINEELERKRSELETKNVTLEKRYKELAAKVTERQTKFDDNLSIERAELSELRRATEHEYKVAKQQRLEADLLFQESEQKNHAITNEFHKAEVARKELEIKLARHQELLNSFR